MSTINISDLHPAGSELFSDSEGYMNELGDNEFDSIYGGLLPVQRSSVQCAKSAAGGAAVVGAGIAGWITGEK